jgi:rod shape-determining protein MreC
MAASAGQRFALLLLAAVIASAALVFLDGSGILYSVRPILLDVVAPVSKLVQSVIHLPGIVSGTAALERENEMLRTEVKRLMAENVALRELRLENERLRAQLGLQEANPGLQLLPAEIKSRDLTGTSQVVVIDRGSVHGVNPGMAVIAPEGLVGKVIEVGGNFSRVLLIIDVNSSVNATIEGSGADGIVVGQWQAGGWLKMRYIQQGSPVRPGDKVVTNGLGGGFPKGLLIGEVLSVAHSPIELSDEADLQPAVDFSQLRVVSVVVSER